MAAGIHRTSDTRGTTYFSLFGGVLDGRPRSFILRTVASLLNRGNY